MKPVTSRRHLLANALRAAGACAVGAAAVVAAPPVRAQPTRAALRFGLTPVFLDDRLGLLRRWRGYLEQRLGLPVEFVQRGSYAQVMQALGAHEAEVAWICGYPFVRQARELQLVAVPQWRGRPLYQSYLIVDAGEAGAKWQRLADLRGRTFAYSDPLSNSGFLYPQHLLRSEGFDAATFFGRSFFTYSHRHVVEAVAEGLAEAGAVDGYVWETLAELHPELTARTRVLRRSPDFGFPPIVASNAAARERVAAFTEALLAMPVDATGRLVLRELRLDRFVPGDASLFRGIAEMARQQG